MIREDRKVLCAPVESYLSLRRQIGEARLANYLLLDFLLLFLELLFLLPLFLEPLFFEPLFLLLLFFEPPFLEPLFLLPPDLLVAISYHFSFLLCAREPQDAVARLLL